PLLCFEAQTGDFWHGELRPGDVGTSRGALQCVQACFRKIPGKGQRVILRADKGFFDHKLIDWVEEQGAGYVIVARLTPPIQRRLSGLRYRPFGWGVRTASFRYQPHGWTRPARFVVVRRPQPEDPGEQLRLFQLGRYHYQVLVTNLLLQPLNLWRFYNERAAVELIVKQLKGDYALGHIPTPPTPLPVQRNLLSPLAAGLQPDELVQAALLAARVSDRNLANATAEDPAHGRATPTHRQPPSAGPARQRTTGACLEIRTQQN